MTSTRDRQPNHDRAAAARRANTPWRKSTMPWRKVSVSPKPSPKGRSKP